MSPHKSTKLALDENRMSILGVQILFGFQLQAPFQQLFDVLPESSRVMSVAAFCLLTAAIALLIAPSAYHRIMEQSSAEGTVRHEITWLMDLSLLLLGVAIALDLAIVGRHALGHVAGMGLGGGFAVLAFTFWYGIAIMNRSKRPRSFPEESGRTRVEDRIDYVLTEARVVLPGVQALLGFQLIVILTEAFSALPQSSVLMHFVALTAVAISAVFLIAPASHHRLVFGGHAVEAFLPIASRYLLSGTVMLALGMAADSYVIVTKVVGSEAYGIGAALVVGGLCVTMWHVVPLTAAHLRLHGIGRPKAGRRASPPI